MLNKTPDDQCFLSIQSIGENPVEHDLELASDVAYRLRPAADEIFPVSTIKSLINGVLNDVLRGKDYNAADAGKWTRAISDEVNTKIKENTATFRFKHVVQVAIGQQLGAGCNYIARCCWDADSDSQVTHVYSNTSLFCVCSVFGVFQY